MTAATLQLGSVSIGVRDYASSGNAVLGIRDSGKSYTATYLAERLMDARIPIIAFDPIGVWRFLRVAGKGAGYPVVVAGGEHGDLPLTVASAPEIVRAAMREGVSLVIDLYSMELSKADWKRIVQSCVRVLLYENKGFGLRHIFIEEAAEFAPQRVGPDQGMVYAEIEKLARMGGNALLGYTLINQRAEEVNKAVLELCDTLILHRQKGRNSLTALQKWLDMAGAVGAKEIVPTLPMLAQGEAWAWVAGSDTPLRIKVPAKRTYHPDRRAVRDQAPAEHKTVDVAGFVAGMSKTLVTVEAEIAANDPKRLKARIAELEREMRGLVGKTVDGTVIEAERKKAWREGYVNGFSDGVESIAIDLSSALDDGETVIGRLRDLASEKEEAKRRYVRTPSSFGKNHPPAQPLKSTYHPDRERIAPAPREHAENGDARSGTGAELRILKVLAQRHPARLTDAQWATLAGMKRTGGTWSTYKSRLRTAGLIEQNDKLFAVSPLGLDAADHVPAAPSSPDDIIAMWKRAVGPGPSKMLDALIAAEPHGLDRANLADLTRMTASGGTFSTYLSRLRSNGLVEISGRRIRASPTLTEW